MLRQRLWRSLRRAPRQRRLLRLRLRLLRLRLRLRLLWLHRLLLRRLPHLLLLNWLWHRRQWLLYLQRLLHLLRLRRRRRTPRSRRLLERLLLHKRLSRSKLLRRLRCRRLPLGHRLHLLLLLQLLLKVLLRWRCGACHGWIPLRHDCGSARLLWLRHQRLRSKHSSTWCAQRLLSRWVERLCTRRSQLLLLLLERGLHSRLALRRQQLRALGRVAQLFCVCVPQGLHLVELAALPFLHRRGGAPTPQEVACSIGGRLCEHAFTVEAGASRIHWEHWMRGRMLVVLGGGRRRH